MRANHTRLQAIAAILLATTGTACRMGDQGLAGVAGPPSVAPGAGSPSSPPPVAPARADSGSSSPTSSTDAGASTPTITADGGAPAPDAALVPDPPSSTTPPVVADAGIAPEAPAASPCLALPMVPQPVRVVDDLPRSDEITFDNEGRLIAFAGSDVIRVVRGSAMQLIARNVISQRGGAMRVLADGDIVVADYARDRLLRIDSRNGVERAPMALRSPMKLVRGPAGTLYVTSTDGIIYRVEPRDSGSGIRGGGDNGDREVVAQTRLSMGGLSFSADYKKLYVGANDERAIYVFPVDERGMLGREVRWATNIPKPQALTTDACGNVYVVGNEDGRIRRISVDGKVTVIAELPAQDIWALAFGSGKHGFAADALYALDRDRGDLFEVKVGIGETPAPSIAP